MRSVFKLTLAALLGSLLAGTSYGQAPGRQSYVSAQGGTGYFKLAAGGQAAPISISADDYKGVKLAVGSLVKDITAVTKAVPAIDSSAAAPSVRQVVIVGTVGKSPKIDQLVNRHKLDVSSIAGKWEAYVLQVVANPFPGVDRALVIAGSNKRGTIYGVYDLSNQIGVSPWYWWADVPVKPQASLYVKPGRYTDGEPAVKYRGIFINDEAPAFSGWTKEKFGGVNHQMYAKMFELILRLKGNYLWPAMWGNAFNDDDPQNRQTADDYGVVMGTSHHEPMDRAQQEWKRYGKGEWDYNKNSEVLRDFWRKGIQNMGNAETIVTVGMRGDGDMAMEQGTNIALLEKIVKDQRQIITEVTGKPAEQTPQMWALYKEVQDYYDKGMRVPDDVTLLLCDDNWGNIRKLPALNDKPHKGGYGIYYHFDYVGGPRNYKWLNTNPISKTWEQMHLAYAYGARQVWIVNVGDLKPMEFPISFFLDYAWNPNRWSAANLQRYTREWATQQFGPQHSAEIARLITAYSSYNGRRKPELLDQNTYSLTNYREFETVVADYNRLRDEAKKLYSQIPASYKDAYYELVMHPIEACANLNELYYEAAKNKWYAAQGRAATNSTAAKVQELFAKDKEISNYYNTQLAGGKWSHMMDQTHIGYTYWQQPPADKMPAVKEIEVPEAAAMGVSPEGETQALSAGQNGSILPQFTAAGKEAHYIEVFNKGKKAFTYTISSPVAYLKVSPQSGTVTDQQRAWVTVDWAKAPKKVSTIPLTITGADGKVIVNAMINNTLAPQKGIFNEVNGYAAIEANHYHKAVSANGVSWMVIPDYGRTQAGVMPWPATAARQQPGGSSAHLEYTVNLPDTGWVNVEAYISPTIDFANKSGLHYAVSLDGGKPQEVNINADNSERAWNMNVANSINKTTTKIYVAKPGIHTLNYWMVDPAVVLQKLVINAGGEKPSYLGPPGE